MTSNNAVIVALDEQVTCYRRLAKLAEQQHEHVQKSNTEALLEVLKNRQVILDHLAGLEQIVGPAKKRWAEFLTEIAADVRGKAETMVGETRRLLEQIMNSDRRDALVLQQQKLNLGKQIHKAASAKQINRMYATAAYGQRKSTMNITQ
jgi:hypothetical protein